MNLTAFFALLGGLLVLAFVANRLAQRTRVAGQFENVTRGFGTLALILILFEGGLELDARETLRHLGGGLMLSWVAYVITVALVAWVAKSLLPLTWRDAVLVGAVLGCVSSTIMLPVLQQIPLRKPVKLTLLVEASIGDVLAVLTVDALLNIDKPHSSVLKGLFGGFVFELGASVVFGVVAGLLWSWLMPRLSDHRFWQALTFAAVLILYAGASAVKASGLFAVLVFGIVLANLPKVKKQILDPDMGIDLPGEGSHLKILSFHTELAFLVRSFFFVMIGAIVHFSGLRANVFPILGFIGAILVARWLAVIVSRWTWKGITSAERDVIILLLPRGLITAVLAIEVMDEKGPAFGFLRAVAFAIILLTNFIVVLGSFRARRSAPTPVLNPLVSQEAE
jgi:potassium/hydrogen antiporter